MIVLRDCISLTRYNTNCIDSDVVSGFWGLVAAVYRFTDLLFTSASMTE